MTPDPCIPADLAPRPDDGTKPLFIPLRREYFEEFRDGSKDTEYRLHGARWNERTCRVGRPVVLSLGYGKRHRLTGTVSSFHQSTDLTPAFVACYPDAVLPIMACIGIKLAAFNAPD